MPLRSGLLAAVVAAAACMAPRVAAAQGYTVVVHASNATRALPRDEVAALFLRQVRAWPDGRPVHVVDLAERSPVRSAFSQGVLDRPAAAVVRWWQQQAFSGGERPPSQRASDAEVLEFVRANPSAVGYVSDATRLPAGVRAVAIVPR